jgi:hypothetical protein
VEVVFLNHGGGSFDHIQKSVIFIMIRYLFRLHFHFALSILKMIRRTVPAIPLIIFYVENLDVESWGVKNDV